jgi:NAD(P)-dependent dehydrogenase (short-subunit alcohol dehydrogenase family)
LRRHVDPTDIAEAVAFLASPAGRNITGVEIRVDAGQVIG